MRGGFVDQFQVERFDLGRIIRLPGRAAGGGRRGTVQ